MFIYWNGKVRNVCFVTALHRNVPNKEHFESNGECNIRTRCGYRYITNNKLNHSEPESRHRSNCNTKYSNELLGYIVFLEIECIALTF